MKHLDGMDGHFINNCTQYAKQFREKSARAEFFYFSDDGDLTALRYDNWKRTFMEQRAVGTLRIWGEPFVRLRAPKL